MIGSALLLAAAVLTPSTGPATVPTGIRPPVSVGTTNLGCGTILLRIDSPERVGIAFTGDLGDQPPTIAPVSWTLHRTPGTRLTATVVYHDTNAEAASIDVKVPPCLGDPVVVVDDTILIPPVRVEARRVRFWHDTLKRWGAW